MNIPAGLSPKEFSLVIHSVPFHTVENAALADLLNAGRVIEAEAGEIVLVEGSAAQVGLHVVIDGRVEVYLAEEDPQGDRRPGEVQLARLGPGGCFGEFALIDQLPSSASVRALTHARVFFVSARDFVRFRGREPETALGIYHNLLAETIRKIRQMNSELDLIRVE